MKKLVSVLLVVMMAFSALPVMADNTHEDVLLKVKAKIDVPEELTEFNYSENKYDDVMRYDFTWRTEDYTKELYVSSDSHGRIVTYNYYEQIDYSQDRVLIDYTLSDAQPLAWKTMSRMFPEYFENDPYDKLTLDEANRLTSYSGRYKTFTFTFNRFYSGDRVESNKVVLRIRATKDKMYVQSVSASLDDKLDFVIEDEDEKRAYMHSGLKTDEEKYEANFPIRFYYAKDYTSNQPSVRLYYSIDRGYMSPYTGKVVTEVRFDRYAGVTEDSAADMEAGGALMSKNEAVLSPQEQSEIDKMVSLVKIEEVENKLRNLHLLKITEDMVFGESYTYKTDGKYYVNFTLKNEERRMTVTYNGETGEIISIYSYKTKYEEKKDKNANYRIPESDLSDFVVALAGAKVDETKTTFNSSDESCTMNCERIVNGVPYIENRINVTYDMENNMVTRYSISWDEDVSKFPNPEDAIGIDAVREKIFSLSKIEDLYVNIGEGYIYAITIEKPVTLDAVTGEELYSKEVGKVAYTDINSHWAEVYINILWEHDIYLTGGKFKPDEAITQADMVRLFSACRDSGIIPIGWTKERIAEYAVTNGYVEAEEPDKLMTRREAFKTFVEILGYGEIAEFDIYKSSYNDMTADGSAEILKAMGVLRGDTARPDDYLTHAEAAVMVYRYLSK